MIDKLKNLFLEDEDEDQNEFASVETGGKEKSSKPTKAELEDGHVILTEPLSYSESQKIADYIKARRSVIINLHRVTPDQAKRIIDFISGTVYALNGSIKRISDDTFYIAPSDVNISGAISDNYNEHE